MGLFSSLKSASSKPYKTVSVTEAKELLASGAALIDVRSAAAARLWASKGFEAYSPRSVNVAGGITEWYRSGHPVRRSQGTS